MSELYPATERRREIQRILEDKKFKRELAVSIQINPGDPLNDPYFRAARILANGMRPNTPDCDIDPNTGSFHFYLYKTIKTLGLRGDATAEEIQAAQTQRTKENIRTKLALIGIIVPEGKTPSSYEQEYSWISNMVLRIKITALGFKDIDSDPPHKDKVCEKLGLPKESDLPTIKAALLDLITT